MTNQLKYFFTSIGLFPIKEINQPLGYDYKDYDLKKKSDKEKIIQHKEFLKSILEEENNRLGYIENKTSQIISQTSIVFSLVGLIVPLIIDRFEDAPIYLKIIVILLLLLTFLFYLLAITNALKNFDVKKFKYPHASQINVIKLKENSLSEFNSELVRDYLYCINKTININNLKATNLLHSYKSFKLGNFSTGIIVIFVCSMLLFTKSEEQSVQIKNPIEIKDLNKILNQTRPIFIIPNDTLKKEKITKS